MIRHIKNWLRDTFVYKKRRSPMWPRVRREHLKSESECQYCGGKKSLQVHHILAYHTFPARELDPTNLITLCEFDKIDCHLKQGHGGNWKLNNPNIRILCNIKKEAAAAVKAAGDRAV